MDLREYYRKIREVEATIEKALQDREGHLKLAVAAKARILKDYSWETITDQYIDLFERASSK